MKLTDRQSAALDVILGNSNILLYGGARSGKTVLAIYFLIYVCLTFPGIRCLVARRYSTDIRASIWNDSLPKILRLLDLKMGKEWKGNEQQMCITFPNGSEITCNGLDDKERVDKVLGQEYGIIYINESQDIPFQTIKVLKTRLAQKINQFRNRFICDLNPTSINHWTYQLFIQRVNPDTNEPVKGTYGYAQMNPYDNRVNLSEGFIEEQLESLTGEERKRFLLGEYSSNSDLQVFHPTAIHEDLDADFSSWAHGRWREVRITGALDLGFEDADAFVELAYIDGEPDVWLVEEYKERKNDISTLAKDLKGCILKCNERYPLSAASREEFQIWTDTGGLGRKTAQELAEAFELPVRAAYKRDKDVGLYFVQDDINYGRLHIRKGGVFHDETRKVVWQRNKDTGKVEKVLDDNAFHPDVLDAVIYAYRFLMRYGNEAMMGRTVERLKEPDKGFFDMQAEVMKALNVEEAVW